jgi:D-lactate dehydrogenase (cytochrome)
MSAQITKDDFAQRLCTALGADKVTVGDAVVGLATDVYRARKMPLAVVRPDSIEELQTVVRTAAASGIALYTRGGGASYTDGYLPSRPNSILIDMSGLNRITEVNADDGYVTVEAGVTWAQLKTVLDAQDLRTPFFGPFSGMAATVGGSMSQHSVSHGSGAHGISAESVIGLDVVTADGALLRTGAAARGGAPFSRWHGPDLAGLFLGDCGVFGIKARVTLALRRRLPAVECASYAFDELTKLARGLRAAALEGIDDEHFAMDAALTQGQIKRQARISKFVVAKDLVASATSPLAAFTQLLRTAFKGTRELRAAAYTAHFVMEGIDQREAGIKARRLRELMRAAGGTEIANTVPAVVRSKPFAPLFNTLGPDGERWVPLHGYIPHSRVAEFHAAATEFLSSRRGDMQRLGIWCGGMFMTVGTTSFLYELAFYWPGAQSAYHRHTLPREYLDALPQRADDPETVAYMDKLKLDLVALYSRHQAVHFQLGKAYPYASLLSAEPLKLVRALKQALDPGNLMNPGALEL